MSRSLLPHDKAGSPRRTASIKQSWLIGIAWVAMVLMRRLPQIALNEFFAIAVSFVWIWLVIAAISLATT